MADANDLIYLDRLADFALLPDHVQELGTRLQGERDEAVAEIAKRDRRPLAACPAEWLYALRGIEDISAKLNARLRVPLEAFAQAAVEELAQREYEQSVAPASSRIRQSEETP